MRFSILLYLLGIVFFLCSVLLPLHCTNCREIFNNPEYSEDYDSPKPLQPMNRGLLTDCVTPNGEHTYCIPIRQCEVLFKQWNNPIARKFLNDSRCGPRNEDIRNPKVCCGKFDKFTNVTFVREENMLPGFCGQQNVTADPRIIGGVEASPGEYPWMARLIYINKFRLKVFQCMGFLIHPKVVVTAAHCASSKSNIQEQYIYEVVLGAHNTETDSSCSSKGNVCVKRTFRVSKVITHPKYDPNNRSGYNDIAIIILKRNVSWTDFIRPICLPKPEMQIPAKYYISGWGKTEKVIISAVKMKAQILPFDKDKCKEVYRKTNIFIKDTQICAGGEERTDTCVGDSGGPLMMKNDNGIWYAAGVVSFGMGCGTKGWPGVYTNVVKFLPWIKTQIAQNMVLTESTENASIAIMPRISLTEPTSITHEIYETK